MIWRMTLDTGRCGHALACIRGNTVSLERPTHHDLLGIVTAVLTLCAVLLAGWTIAEARRQRRASRRDWEFERLVQLADALGESADDPGTGMDALVHIAAQARALLASVPGAPLPTTVEILDGKKVTTTNRQGWAMEAQLEVIVAMEGWYAHSS